MSSSEPPSPTQGAKSFRVCLNCRRKKKRCDKALPTCGRCAYSNEICVHEGDGSSDDQRSIDFESLSIHSLSRRSPFPSDSGFEAVSPLTSFNPRTFEPIAAADEIHVFVFRSLLETVGNRPAIEQVVSSYFENVNTWFSIIDKANFENRLREMWSNPSAEVSLIVLCMFLANRLPLGTSIGNMRDGLYLSVKSILALVEAQVALSVPLLQSKLLVALYENSHSMTQHAFVSLGSCIQMTRAFGWNQAAFWSEGSQRGHPRELRECSLIWWTIVSIDCQNAIAYPNLKYPLSTPEVDFSIPGPETFNYLLPSTSDHGMPSLARAGMVFDDKTFEYPLAKSAAFAQQVLRERFDLPCPRHHELSDAITNHVLDIMSGPWEYGHRFLAVTLAFIATMMLHEPYLKVAATTKNSPYVRSLETVSSIVNSVYHISQTMNANDALQAPESLSPGGALCIYYAARVLIEHGGVSLNSPGVQWMVKVNGFKRSLEIFRRRWSIADTYLRYLDQALQQRAGQARAQ